LISFIKGEVKLEPAQVSASLGLLKKILPDLTSAEIKSEVTHNYVARVPAPSADMAEWQKHHADRIDQTLQ
jgi:hypothetical protein